MSSHHWLSNNPFATSGIYLPLIASNDHVLFCLIVALMCLNMALAFGLSKKDSAQPSVFYLPQLPIWSVDRLLPAHISTPNTVRRALRKWINAISQYLRCTINADITCSRLNISRVSRRLLLRIATKNLAKAYTAFTSPKK